MALPFNSTAPFAVNHWQSPHASHEAAAQSETPPTNLTVQQQLEPDVAAIAEDIQNDLYKAADAGDVAAAASAISKGASVHTPNKDQCNRVPLLAAAAGRKPAMVLLLVKHGAKLAVRDANGFTAVDVAVAEGDCEVLKVLLTLGADPTSDDAGYETAFEVAVSNGYTAEVACILAHSQYELTTEMLLRALRVAAGAQLHAAIDAFWDPFDANKQREADARSDLVVTLLDAAAAKDAAAAHFALCSSLSVMLPPPMAALLAGLQRALLQTGAAAADLAQQQTAVQQLTISMALAHKQQQREVDAQSQKLAQQRQELEQMKRRLTEQQRQIAQQLAKLHAAQKGAGPSDAAAADAEAAARKRRHLA